MFPLVRKPAARGGVAGHDPTAGHAAAPSEAVPSPSTTARMWAPGASGTAAVAPTADLTVDDRWPASFSPHRDLIFYQIVFAFGLFREFGLPLYFLCDRVSSLPSLVFPAVSAAVEPKCRDGGRQNPCNRKNTRQSCQ